ncbi:ATP-binding cassette domain-containing protein [Candidatus Babeliales bacterium]|nr:ATP-binding cassette domain-containing protein [Candidatus Babeliales bacterium]
MFIADDIFLELGPKLIFDDISFCFQDDQKIGVVGSNGAGKSTLLKVLSGHIGLDRGTISYEKKKKVGYLPQEVVLSSNLPVLEEALTVFADLTSLKKELEELDAYFHSGITDFAEDKIERYAHVQAAFAEVNFDQQVMKARNVLEGLGFSEEHMNKTVDQLSVGWRMRLVLAKLLLQEPDFFLFDEPTNHLDVVAKDWFLGFLKNCSAGFLLVSHDRYFLDHAVDHIFELDRGKGRLFYGNYSHYLRQKEDEEAAHEAAYVRQQKEIKEKKETIERFRAKVSKAKMAQSMMKSLEKMEVLEPTRKSRTVRFNFPDVVRAGNVVLKVENLSKSYDGRPIFNNVSFELNRGDKAAIVAANGKGKTTLLSAISGLCKPDGGTVEFGYNVLWSMFEQDQDKLLNKNKEILQDVEDACKTSEQRARMRALLGAFLFPGNDVYKKIGVLSGGEKNRVAMVKVLLQSSNFLILDEPTNHLDIESKEILLKALQEYPGTILFVSHDRTFLDALPNRIFELTSTGIISYSGDYSSYLYQKEAREALVAQNSPIADEPEDDVARAEQKDKQQYDAAKKLAKLERHIEKLEKQLTECGEKFAILEYGTKEFDKNADLVDQIKKDLKIAYAEWEQIQPAK